MVGQGQVFGANLCEGGERGTPTERVGGLPLGSSRPPPWPTIKTFVPGHVITTDQAITTGRDWIELLTLGLGWDGIGLGLGHA
jgi:hypothetical protein